MNYNKEPLGSLCLKVSSGGTPKSTKSEYYDGGTIPWLNTKEVNFCRIYETEKKITQLGLDNSAAKIIEPNRVIVAMYGATAARVAINKIELSTNQACCNLKIDPNKADYEYVYYCLLNEYEHLASLANGGAQQNLNSLTIKNFKIPVPDLKIQKKIVRILSALDQKIELNNRQNITLTELAKTLFADRVGDEMYGDNSISDYLLPKRGKPLLSKDAKDGAIPVVAGGLEPSTYHNQSNTASPVITISASGANAGYVRLWGEKVWSSDSSFIDNSITENVYFWYVLLSRRQKEIYDAQTGSAQPHIYPKHIGDMPVGNISDEIISNFNNTVKPLFEKVFKNEKENITLSSLRDTLLPKLMLGEINLDKVEI